MSMNVGAVGIVAPRAHAESHRLRQLDAVGRRAALLRDGSRPAAAVPGSSANTYGSGPRVMATSPAPRCTRRRRRRARPTPRRRTIGDQGERSLVLDPDRPRRVHDRAQDEGAARPRSVEQAGEGVHRHDRRRSRHEVRALLAMERLTRSAFHWSHDYNTRSPRIDPGGRRHRQDRPPRGEAAEGPARARPHRLPRRRAARSTGSDPDTWDAPLSRRRRGLRRTTHPTSRSPAPPIGSRPSPGWRSSAASGGWCCSRAANEEGAQLAEQAVQTLGAEWTIVRSSMFSQNFSEGFLARVGARAASSRSRPGTWPSRSSTSTTSPTSRWPR